MTTSKNTISHSTGVSTFASCTSPSTGQSLQKSFHLSHADKIEIKKISSPSENKKYPTAQPDTTNMMKRSIVNGLQRRWTEGQLITAVWRNGGLSASYQHLW
jgi:Holliday junction resolvase RusA-like endonuclease